MNNFENARILKAFGDERRLDILMELQNGEMGASELIEKLNIGQSTLLTICVFYVIQGLFR